ncbi:MAG: hypothetical protein P9M14_10020 [Candidatus Alcyoniella australis]|nr:hypothetical protein [Candidatus Alcyoniella australis]
MAALIVCCWLVTIDERSELAGADESHYLIHSTMFSQRLDQGKDFLVLAMNAGIDRGPLIFALSGAIVSWEQGSSIDRLRGLNLPAWVALLWAVYFLARPLVGRAWALLAAMVSGLAPATWEVGGFFNYHILEALLYSATLVLLIRSRGLTKFGYSFSAGICAGLMLLSAHAFPLPMLLPPLMLCAVWGLRTKGIELTARGLLLFVLPAYVIARLYIRYYYNESISMGVGYMEGGLGEMQLSLWAYLRVLLLEMQQPVIGLLGLLLLPIALLAGRRDWSTWILALAGLPPLLWMSMFGPMEQVFNPGYLFPVLPPLIVMLVVGAHALPSATARRVMYFGILGVALIGWSLNLIHGPKISNPMAHHTSAPAYGEPCERLSQRLSGLEGRAAIYFISYKEEHGFTALDLFACTGLVRPDLNALMAEPLNWVRQPDAPVEIWAVAKQRGSEKGSRKILDRTHRETVMAIDNSAGFKQLRPTIEIDRFMLDDSIQAVLLADPGLFSE